MKAHLCGILLVTCITCSTSWGLPPARGQQGPTAAGPPMMTWNQGVSMFHEYMDVIGSFAQVAKDSSASGVAAVVYADDVLRTRPPQEAIDYYLKLLPEVKDPAVQRAIHLRLADHYRLSNQPDKALEQLKQLMIAPRAGS
jgi:hypothetical protein